MREQSCYFAHKTYCFFWRSRCRPRRSFVSFAHNEKPLTQKAYGVRATIAMHYGIKMATKTSLVGEFSSCTMSTIQWVFTFFLAYELLEQSWVFFRSKCSFFIMLQTVNAFALIQDVIWEHLFITNFIVFKISVGIGERMLFTNLIFPLWNMMFPSSCIACAARLFCLRNCNISKRWHSFLNKRKVPLTFKNPIELHELPYKWELCMLCGE